MKHFVTVECSGCGQKAEVMETSRGRLMIPIGWIRLIPSRRTADGAGSQRMPELLICRAECCQSAVEGCFQPSAAELTRSTLERVGSAMDRAGQSALMGAR